MEAHNFRIEVVLNRGCSRGGGGLGIFWTGKVEMDTKTRDVLHSMLSYVRLWRDDYRAVWACTQAAQARGINREVRR